MSPKLIFSYFLIVAIVLMVGFFTLQIKDETSQMEMAKLGYCKYNQPGLNSPAYFKCKEYPAQNE